ncbi:hypothetical protein EG68_00604 [Paragonimus skrjabini miyazakii]|uniref:Acyltransferase C-terminal domain-containing protein n=1 Tax=Paragonimus skrjabini miyazakii TaxID=59628 RepID=A0A8S9Z526_9TREM|nr:hypothetical protein EG68_00604 [Paragonimus skrjabini miyazakii]
MCTAIFYILLMVLVFFKVIVVSWTYVEDKHITHCESCIRVRTLAQSRINLINWLPDQHTFHIHITRIPIHAVPKEPSELQSWLFNRFRIKDKLVENIQNRFYPNNDKNEITVNSNSHILTRNNMHMNTQKSCLNSNDITNEIVKCLPEELERNVIQLEPLKLHELLPSVLFFYGLTFYWIFGFGWYGPISFLLVAIFGSILGEVYVHYFV